MEIKKRLITPPSKEVNAVLLSDEGEEYPVFLESLHNTIIFPLLIESGYSLNSLPYGFTKNGLDFEQLPVENYTPDDKTEEMMYNSIGIKTPMDEINAHVHIAPKHMNTPATNYTIFTREDFIKYLDALMVASLEDDYMPLNYFVAPDARFTLQEWHDPANLKYVQVISDRRKMSLAKFARLVTALQKINLAANYTAMDVLDAYFAWGFDGLQFDMVGRRRESRPIKLTANRNVNVPIIDHTSGLVDGMKNILLPENQKNKEWRLSVRDPKYLDAVTMGLKPNDTRVVSFCSGGKQDVTIVEGSQFNVKYSLESLIIQLQIYPTILVKSPVRINEYLALDLALPNNKEALYEYCMMDALSKMLYDYRRPHVKISSYNALKVAGCNPRTVLDYVITKYNMSRDLSALERMSDDVAPQIFDYDIDRFLNGESVSEEIRDFLEDVISGVFNIDEIDQGKSAEASVNTDEVFKEIYAIHNVLGVSLTDIYDKFRTITPDVQYLTFSGKGLNYNMDVRPLQYSLNGYKRDVMNYDLQNARDCTFFTYVTLIAREVGDERAKRHVGIEFYLVNRNKNRVKEIIEDLKESYENKVTSMIPNATQQAQQLRLINMFALSRYFEIAFKGTITWPKILGGAVEPAMPSLIQDCRKYLERRIENITAYCAFTANTASSRTLTFNAYCTNAYITPEYVIPRSDAPIREIPFFAAWFDWRSNDPNTWQALVNNNVIPIDFVSWSRRYADEQFVIRDLLELDSKDSLVYYYEHANEEINVYPEDKDFVSVSHPMSYMFPGLENEDNPEEMPTLSVPRTGLPVVRLGICHDLVKKDYEDKLLPCEDLDEVDTYIRPFRGFNAETIMTVDNVFDKVPGQSDNCITVLNKSGSIYINDQDKIVDYTYIPQLDMSRYNIKHICDRMYLLRATDGKLWEVHV